MRLLKHKFTILFVVIAGILFISGYNVHQDATYATAAAADKEVAVSGNVTDSKAAAACFAVLQENLQAANNEDAKAYAATLIASAQTATKKEMQSFFEEYDLEHKLLSFEVVKQDKDSMLVAAEQQTLNIGENSYRSHITQAHHTFIKENNAWKISETTMTNTEFIE